MRILITNDDGLHSHGLTHLEAELRAHHDEVWAIAPDRERSATSQAITIFDTMRLVRVGERHYTLTGFPTDCVNVALYSGIFPSFDLVISGINHGVNLGDDVHYSGTVGAARHAALHHKLAVAVSCPIREKSGDFRRVARWLRIWLGEQVANLDPGIVYNVNYPEENGVADAAPLPDFRFTRQGRRHYNDRFDVLEDGASPEGDYKILRLRESEMGHDSDRDSDFGTVSAGFVAVTPLNIDTSHKAEIQRWTTRNHSANK